MDYTHLTPDLDDIPEAKALAERKAPGQEWVRLVEQGQPLFPLLMWLGEHLDLEDIDAEMQILRTLLKAFPSNEAWDELEEAVGFGIESILATVSSLRWDLEESETEELLPLIRQLPGRAGVDLDCGLVLGERKPSALSFLSLGRICRTNLAGWKPRALRSRSLTFMDCTGPLELGNALHLGRNPDNETLEFSPDLEVFKSAGSLSGITVERNFEAGWRATYVVKEGCPGWGRGVLDPEGMDLRFGVTYSRVPSYDVLASLPVGASTTVCHGSLDQIPDDWHLGRLDLTDLDQLETLPPGLRFGGFDLALWQDRFGVFGNSSLHIADCERFHTLPEGLALPLGLHLDHLPALSRIPKSLHCGRGILWVERCPLEEMPLAVINSAREIQLRHLPIRHLPKGIRPGKTFWLTELENLESLPSSLRARSLDLDRLPSLRSLPEKLVAGSLRLSELPLLEAIPSTLAIKDSLTIRNCKSLSSIPHLPEVKGHVSLTALPKIMSLPDGFSAEALCLEDLPIRSLPRGMRVGWDLELKSLPIYALPDCLDPRGSISLVSLPNFHHWPERLSHVDGSLLLEDLPALTDLPDNLSVGGILQIRNCPNLKRLPPGLKPSLASTFMEPDTGGVPAGNQHHRASEKQELMDLIGSSLQSTFALFSMVALRPEFLVRGQIEEDGRLAFVLHDWSGNCRAPKPLATLTSSDYGFLSRQGDFILAPEQQIFVQEEAIRTINEWGFRDRGYLFTYLVEPTEIERALNAHAMPSTEDSPFTRRPFHIHLHAFRRLFLGGGLIAPFGMSEPMSPLPPAQYIQPTLEEGASTAAAPTL